MDLADYLALALRRLWLIVALAALGGLAGYYATRNDSVMYERSMSYVVRPSKALNQDQIPQVLSELRQDGPVIQSIVGTLNSRRFRLGAAAKAGIRGEGNAPVIEVTTRAGSDVIDAAVRGERPTALVPVGDSFSRLATDWVVDTYRIYEMESLGAEATPRALPAQQPKIIAVAVIGGIVLALFLVFLEGTLRAGASRAKDRRSHGEEDRSISFSDDRVGERSAHDAMAGDPVREGNSQPDRRDNSETQPAMASSAFDEMRYGRGA